jgi:hypothetical protein
MKTFIKILLLVLFSSTILFSQEINFNGKWTMMREKSTDIDSYQALSIEFSIKKDEITIYQEWGHKKFEEKMSLKTNGKIHNIEIKNRIFPSNIFMGLKMPIGEKKEVTAVWENNNVLKIKEKYDIICSQGTKTLIVTHIYELSEDKNAMTYKIQRSTRDEGPEVKYLLKKADMNNAYVMRMTDNWEIDSKLPEQACLISLQGVVNENKPYLYFIYGEQWDFRFTPTVFDYLKDKRYFAFTQLNTLEQAINIFKEQIKGYIIWDKKVRTSLIVAYTLAGLEKSIIITEDLIPLAQKYGLKQVEDFRGKFTGWSDYEIYSWAQDQYWNQCSKDYIVWLGGEHGNTMKPGVADFGMTKKVFFTDLSSKESDTLECSLTKKLFSEMKPLSLVMGWHSYKKDLEETFVTLTSRYGLRMEGLHSLPNMSFMSKIPLSPGYKFKNNHNIKPDKKYIPDKKVYISFIQTDCLGLGAWTKPGRGSIPYTWEVTMNWVWLAPVMLEFFYSQATPNDYFLGALSGPGYLYPKVFPKKLMPKMINMAKELMEKLDLNAFEIMDYSDEGSIEGPSELSKEVVESYYDGMPNSIGFVNGYRPSHTFTSKEKRPLISYDYYLSKDRPEADAVADLKELTKINSDRPYFLLAHIRQWSDITRVKSIYDKLGPEFELVPLDVFLKLAGENPTFKERFMNKK